MRNLNGPVFAVYAEHDDYFGPPVREQLRGELEKHGKPHEIRVYSGTGHGFFNDTRAEVYNREAAKDGWGRVLTLFRENL